MIRQLTCHLLMGFIIATAAYPVFSSTSDVNKTEDADVSKTDIESPAIVTALDSMTDALFFSAWKIPDTNTYKNPYGFAADEVPVYNDSTYKKRLALIPSEIQLEYNDYVRAFIDLYVKDRREQVRRMLGLKELYFPFVEEELDRRGLPHNLKYLAIVESALNPNAVSRMGATGLWQIMYSTGRLLDLEINSFIDERRDPYRSTEAALTYLESMYKIYGDWLLVIAAYNCGPGNVNKAIRRSGGKRDFWELRQHLPRETRGYVPAFIAATYMMNYYEEHNLVPMWPEVSYNAVDTFTITEELYFDRLIRFTGISDEELRYLNPAVKKGVIPASRHGYALKMPVELISSFEANRDSIFYMPVISEQEEVVAQAATTQHSSTPSNHEKLWYTVKSGDNLGFIAEWYDCSAQEIRNWNGMYGSDLRVGRKLTIYVPAGKEDKYAGVNSLSFAEKRAIEDRQHGRADEVEIASSEQHADCDCVYYEVKSGDTLWDISRKYPNVSIDDIKRVNKIYDSRSLKPGMTLKIKI